MPPFLKKLDLFGVQLPNFNLRGRETIRTSSGGVMSLGIATITFLFAAVKMVHLTSRFNPNVSYYIENDYFTDEFKFNFGREQFMLAFAVEDYFTLELKADTRYVKYFAQYGNFTNNVPTYKELPIYPCQEEDYAKFFPVDKKS